MPDYCQQVKLTSGFSVMGKLPLAPRHPVDLINPQAVPLRDMELPLDQAVPAYQQMEDHSGLLASAAPVITRDFAVNVTRNVALNSFVDLGPALEGSQRRLDWHSDGVQR